MVPIPYADENPHPEDREPVIGLILANAVMFVLFHGREDVLRLGFIPADPDLYRWFSSQFMHGGIGHIVGNMWALWLFGDNVAARLKRWFLPFYLAGGVAANLLHYMQGPQSPIPCIGASGAVSAVIGAYAVLFPSARLRCFMGFGRRWGGGYGRNTYDFSMSALLWAGLYTGWQFIGMSIQRAGGGGVAYGAHLGGLIFGALAGAYLRAGGPEESLALSGPPGAAPQPRAAVGAEEISAALERKDDAEASRLYAAAARRNPYLELPDPKRQLALAHALCVTGHPHLAHAALERFLLRHGAGDLAPNALTLQGWVEQTYFKEFDSALRRYEAAAAHPRADAAAVEDARRRVAEARSIMDRDAIDPEASAEPCAVLLESAPPLSVERLHAAEVVLGRRPGPRQGILARSLPGPQAARTARLLERAGVPAVIVPEGRLAPLPPLGVVETLAWDERGLSFARPAAWDDCLLIAAYAVAGQGPIVEVFTAEPARYRWPARTAERMTEALRGLVRAAPLVPLELGARRAFAGNLPDAVVFGSFEEAEEYLHWQLQLSRLKRERAYG